MNRQIRRLAIVLLVLYGALFVQLNVVQVLRAEEYTDHPANRRRILRDFGEPRGDIQTADGVVVARSVPSDGQFDLRREYPEPELFAHTTGFYSFFFGADGAERTYNDELVGRKVATDVQSLTDLVLDRDRTADLTLTIHSAVQRAAADALGDRSGSVVALDARTGAVLALYSFPSYDPNLLVVEDAEQAGANRAFLRPEERGSPLRAKAYEERYFPGSTFKVVTAAAALRTGTFGPDDPPFPPAREYLPPQTTRPIRNFGGGTCGGDFFAILRVSCNTAFAELGVRVGAEAMFDTAGAFGFNRRPPLDLASPVSSVFPEPGTFDDNTPLLAQSGIGQNSVSATPLQMALVAAGVINEGRIMAPHVMGEIRDDDGEVVDRSEPTPWQQAVQPDVAAVLRDAMVGVVEDGTATRLAIPGTLVGGKTGTAQLGSDPPRSHAWIIGFAVRGERAIAVAVIVEGQEGASEQTGGRVAAPIAQQVLQAALDAPAGLAEPPADDQ